MTYKQVKNHVEKLGRRFYIVELLVILLLSSFFLGNLGDFSNMVSLTNIDRLGSKRAWWGVGDIRPSFLKNNLVIDWDYYGYMSTCNKKKAFWPGGDSVSSPVFLSPAEKKPYYLFNINIYYPAYPLKLFRNFTKGNGTLKFADNHKEIKAVVFCQEDLDKLRKLKRETRKIVWDVYPLDRREDCKTMGILFLGD